MDRSIKWQLMLILLQILGSIHYSSSEEASAQSDKAYLPRTYTPAGVPKQRELLRLSPKSKKTTLQIPVVERLSPKPIHNIGTFEPIGVKTPLQPSNTYQSTGNYQRYTRRQYLPSLEGAPQRAYNTPISSEVKDLDELLKNPFDDDLLKNDKESELGPLKVDSKLEVSDIVDNIDDVIEDIGDNHKYDLEEDGQSSKRSEVRPSPRYLTSQRYEDDYRDAGRSGGARRTYYGDEDVGRSDPSSGSGGARRTYYNEKSEDGKKESRSGGARRDYYGDEDVGRSYPSSGSGGARREYYGGGRSTVGNSHGFSAGGAYRSGYQTPTRVYQPERYYDVGVSNSKEDQDERARYQGWIRKA